MRLVEGRGFNEEDCRGAQPVYVVNRAFAKAYFQEQEPIGQRLNLAPYIPAGQVVGVVEDVRHLGIDSEPQPIVFGLFPSVGLCVPALAQAPSLQLDFVAESGSFDDAAAESRSIWRANGERIVDVMERLTGLEFEADLSSCTKALAE